MRFAVAGAALSAFIMLGGDAGQSHRQNDSLPATCDNNDHCITFSTITSTLGHRESRSEVKKKATPQHQSHTLDANGNPAGVVISRKTNARARVGIAYAARFQA